MLKPKARITSPSEKLRKDLLLKDIPPDEEKL